MASLLTIAIPTFNRGKKLVRLLSALENELVQSSQLGNVKVLVANNASADDTRDLLEKTPWRHLDITHWSHPKNLGVDQNILFLYRHATTPYIWFFGDDDLPLPGAVSRVIENLGTHHPDVLLAPFIQPPGSWRPELEFQEPYRLISTPREAISSVERHGKLTSYVMRRIELDADQSNEIQGHVGAGWMFRVLCLTVVQRSANLSLLVLPRPIGTCDDDFDTIDFHPDAFLNSYKTYTHSFVKRWMPSLAERRRSESYRGVIKFIWKTHLGDFKPSDYSGWDRFVRRLGWQWPDLAWHPFAIAELALIKTGIGKSFVGPAIAKPRKLWKGVLLYCRDAKWLSRLRIARRNARAYVRNRSYSTLVSSPEVEPGTLPTQGPGFLSESREP